MIRAKLFDLIASPLLSLGQVVILAGHEAPSAWIMRCQPLPGLPPPPPRKPEPGPIVCTLRGDDGKEVEIRAGDIVCVHPDHLDAIQRMIEEEAP